VLKKTKRRRRRIFILTKAIANTVNTIIETTQARLLEGQSTIKQASGHPSQLIPMNFIVETNIKHTIRKTRKLCYSKDDRAMRAI